MYFSRKENNTFKIITVICYIELRCSNIFIFFRTNRQHLSRYYFRNAFKRFFIKLHCVDIVSIIIKLSTIKFLTTKDIVFVINNMNKLYAYFTMIFQIKENIIQHFESSTR